MRTAKSLSHALSRKLLRRLYVDTGDYRNTVFIAGTGRSGTTWLEEIVNFRRDHRVLFEPFHAKEIPLVAHWNYRQYLRADDSDERFLEPARRILSGRVRHPWVDQFNDKHFVKRRIVKDIRANLILLWMRRHFPEIPLILLLRHPCAVAHSKLKLRWQTHLEDFLSQTALVEDFLLPLLPVFESARDDFERHILLWCVENWVPLQQFAADELRRKIHICFYEDFCTQPEAEARRLLDFLHRPFAPALLSAIKRPSALSHSHSAILTGGSILDSWRRGIDAARIDRAVELLSHFGLDRIYDEGSRPKIAADEVLDSFAPNACRTPVRPAWNQRSTTSSR